MGMFDTIKCKLPLPAKAEEGSEFDLTEHEWENIDFQTKDLESYLGEYEIREDGLWEYEDLDSKWEKSNHTGLVYFYNLLTSNDSDKDLWAEFKVLIENGEIKSDVECVKWDYEDNSNRKSIEKEFNKGLKKRMAFVNKWYYKFFILPWNLIVIFVFGSVISVIDWIASLMGKIQRKITF